MADRNLDHLHPVVRNILDRHIELAKKHALPTVVIETYRDEAEQLANWQKGRNAAGEIVDRDAVVTFAKPGQSYHGLCYTNGTPCSLAYHLVVGPPLLGFGDNKMDHWSETLYTVLGQMGEELGMTWGGRWMNPRDWTHYELRVPGKSLTDLKSLIAANGDIDSLFQIA
jgi:peptidoglycan L-alanyl-D-glutamate endopeptidase CwlK